MWYIVQLPTFSIDCMNCEVGAAFFGRGYQWCEGAPERYGADIFRYASADPAQCELVTKVCFGERGFAAIVRAEAFAKVLSATE